MTTASDRDTILELTQKLLVCIIDGDWDTYTELCCPTLTCFEPEALGNLVDGLEFHQYYFNLPSSNSNSAPLPVQAKIVAPHVRVMGDTAVIAYVRLTQKMADGKPITVAMEETRVWHRQQGKWKHVHFHRKALIEGGKNAMHLRFLTAMCGCGSVLIRGCCRVCMNPPPLDGKAHRPLRRILNFGNPAGLCVMYLRIFP
jgi:calcium/calmodulin-dependent protein kinase (CaM kinase) II